MRGGQKSLIEYKGDEMKQLAFKDKIMDIMNVAITLIM